MVDDNMINGVTFAEDHFYVSGGGLIIMGISELTITNSIFYNNTPDQAYQRGNPNSVSSISVSYSDFEDGQGGFVIAGNGNLS